MNLLLKKYRTDIYFIQIYRFDILFTQKREKAIALLKLAILGLLKEKPMHGYELKKKLSYLLGSFWTVSYGSLYPALKKMEKAKEIECAYSVKEKTRNRNVYRITPKGEREFIRLLSDVRPDSALSDTEKFDVRMAFFQYLDPETRILVLEKRQRILQDQVAKFKKYRNLNKGQDRYQKGLLRHKLEQIRSDMKWLERLIAQEKEAMTISEKAPQSTELVKDDGKGEATAASGV